MTDEYDFRQESYPRWLHLADQHLKAANLLFDSAPQQAAFWYHQAAERYLKTFLINHEISFSNSVTNLRALVDLCHANSDVFRVAVRFAELDLMSTWESAFQYPPEPGDKEIEAPSDAMLLAARTICAMLRDLAPRAARLRHLTQAQEETLSLYSQGQIGASEAKTDVGCNYRELISMLAKRGLALPRVALPLAEKMATEALAFMNIPVLERAHKQVIVLRKDLNMRKGKMIAQGAHASLKVVIDQGCIQLVDGKSCLVIPLENNSLRPWLQGNFAKIALGVDSEEELLALHAKALASGQLCALVQDAGLTEFGGVPTYTAVAIGPALKEELDPLTGHLKLL